MKILLVNPPRYQGMPVIREDRCENIDVDCVHPPVSLYYLHLILNSYGHESSILDCNLYDLSYEELENTIKSSPFLDTIIFRSTPSTFHHDIKTVKIAKRYGIKTLMLNWNLHHVPDKVIAECPELDYYVADYNYEKTIPQILDGNINYGSKEKFYDIPPANWRFMSSDFNKCYTRTRLFSPWAVIRGSKGCGYSCAFCIDQGQEWCPRSPSNIVDEIEWLVNRWRVKRISFFDNTYEVGRDWCLEIADEIEKRKLKFKWYINSRADLISKEGVELFKRLHEVGLDGSSIGIEFGSQEMLDFSNKGTTVEDNYQSIEVLHKAGVKSYCSLMMGYLNETEEQMMKTVEFVEKAKPTGFQINPVTAYEGTDLWKQAVEAGKIPEEIDWRGISCVPTDFITIQLSELTTEELMELRKKAYNRLYTGGWFLRNAWNVFKSPSDWKIGLGYLFSMLNRIGRGVIYSH